MDVKCDYCGAMIDERNETCPKCGAPLSGANRMADEQPKTIDQLQAWYTAHHLPPEEVTRFFIGKNITEPKAFGIYKTETGDCVVYKNKADGQRAIRYQGADEAYAVGELYQRLRAEIADQKSHTNAGNADKKKKRKGCLIVVLAVLLFGTCVTIFGDKTPGGYYKYDNTEYYHQGSSWYQYDRDNNSWIEAAGIGDIISKDNASDYKISGHEGGGMTFEESSWYTSNDEGDWDSDDDWSGSDGDWSSSSTDWDSDW